MHKILIANRGEIAVRIVRACRDMGLASVAVYSDADRAALHVRMADEACAIGPGAPAESYLRIDRILDAARASGADAIHPGYGFLSENAGFAAACRDAGVTFIGPHPEAIALMGSKTAARRTAIEAGVPVVPGTDVPLGPEVSDDAVAVVAAGIGYPVMVKAVAGGGGKGMRVVRQPTELSSAIRAARSEAEHAFGDPSIYLERRLDRPRHIEVQLLADHYGSVMPCVERECSIQRRHQKLIEETPSPVMTADLRMRLATAAVAVARSVGYTNAGTVEFLLDEGGNFYFLEMNTRLQVEHAITEAVTGLDLVRWQIRIASGERLVLEPERLLTPRGHAIECRIYAEDADAGFIPSPGRITSLRVPGGPGVRDDGGVEAGGDVPVFYDPLISKLVAWGEDRPHALARMRRALREYEVLGIRTTVPFFTWALEQRPFVEAAFHTEYLDEVLHQRQGQSFSTSMVSFGEVAAIATALAFDRTRSGEADGGVLPDQRLAGPAAWREGGAGFRSGDPRAHVDAGSSWARRARLDALRQ